MAATVAAKQRPVPAACSRRGPVSTTKAGCPITASLAEGDYDIIFSLFAAANGVSPLGGSILRNTVAVSGGVFNTTLDFGGGSSPAAALAGIGGAH